MTGPAPENGSTPRRKGAVPRPVQPVDAVVESVYPSDPLRIGVASFPLRRPLTRRLLETEFGLIRKQAHALAVNAARHRVIRREIVRAAVRFWAVVLVVGVSLALISWFALYEPYMNWVLSRPSGDPLQEWLSIGLGVLIALVGLGLWLAAERWIMDRIVDREIRRCWSDQECIWCGRDMDGCVVDRERWSKCPECGMRSPIGARATTI
ncbi:MAG: hypothetical protein ED559_02475 [Phycisphaera sp.]|nr:MAG: hypothetical protein ED559_02475 [Phycisphaera sp.]